MFVTNRRTWGPIGLVGVMLPWAISVAPVAWSQPADESTQRWSMEEVVVTARKREESLQEVPLSVLAFTEEQLQRSDIADLDDLAAYTPGLQLFENVDRGYGQVFIRGLQNTPPVGDTTRELASVFIDGVYFTGGVSAINTDNLQRVEVIRGPQSALFGRSTFSGAINFITKTPANEFGAKLRARVATDEDREISASIEGPLMGTSLAGRLSARYRDFGGQYTNSLNGDALGEEEDRSLAGQLYFTPNDSLTAKLTLSLLEQEDGPPATSLVGRLPNHNFTSPSGVTFFRGTASQDTAIAQNRFPRLPQDILGLDFATFSFVPFDSLPDPERLGIRRNGLDREFMFASLDVSYEFADGHTLSYLGGYSDEEANRLFDFEFSAEDNYYGQRNTDSTSDSHEIKIASPEDRRFRWLGGLFYLTQSLYERDPGTAFGVGFPFFPIPIEPGQAVILPGPRPIVDRDIENTAIFGSIAYDFTDRLSASLEARWQQDDLADVLDPATGATLSGDTTAFLPRLITEFRLSDDLMVYGSAAKGIRPTTINSQFVARPAEQQAIIRNEFPELDIRPLADPEEIWTYELGIKSTLLDGRALLNANVYYADWQDSQDLRSLLADVDGDGAPDSTLVTINSADIEAYGLEMDGMIALSQNLTLSGAVAWNETTLQGINALQTRFFLDQAAAGARLPQTPKLSGSLAVDYRNDLNYAGLEWFFRAEGNYVGSRYASALNLAETGSSFDLNLRLGVDGERYSAWLFVDNLTDDDTFESLRSNADCATNAACPTRALEAVLPRQRQVGVSVSVNF